MSLFWKIAAVCTVLGVLLVLATTDAFVNERELTGQVFWGIADVADTNGGEKEAPTSIPDALNRRNFESQETDEPSLLSNVVNDESVVASRILLRQGDRAAFFAWIETPDARQTFLILKQALSASFSPDVRDVTDQDGTFTFLDPAMSDERFAFVFAGNRLFEFHIAPGREPDVWTLIDVLTEMAESSGETR